MDSNKKIVIKWEGKMYESDTWDDIYFQVSSDPWFGNVRALKARIKSYYGYSIGRTRTKKDLFHKLAAIGEISIVKEEA